MFPEIKRTVSLSYSPASILSAVINICKEKSEYELLEEVSKHRLQIFVKHYSDVFKKETGYYLNLKITETTKDAVALSVETQEGFQPFDTAAYFDVNKIIKEFVFILKQYLQITSGKNN